MVLTQQLTSSQPTAWDRAVTRAIARNVQPLFLSESHDGAVITRHYVAGSVSRPGTGHHVTVRVAGEQVEAFCDCEGAQNGRACQHAAAALVNAGLLWPR